MPLRATKTPLMSIVPGPVCSYPSALRMRVRGCQKLFTTFPSRATASGSPRKVLSVPKPVSGAVSPSVAPSASEVRDSRLSLLANNLARDGKATLFQAESHAGYMYVGWTGGMICLGGALLLLNEDVYDSNKGLPWFVPGVYRVSAVLLIGFAGWAVARPARRISSIQILPGNDKARLVLDVRRNIPLPFIKPQRMTVLASDVTLQRKVVVPMGKQFQAAPSLRNSDQGFILEVARSIGAALSRFLAGARQFIFSDGIIWVSIKGRGGSWKLDGYGSAREARRYGEPDWEWRPFESRTYGGTVLFCHPHPTRDHRDFPRCPEKSYEEWKLEGHIESGMMIPTDESASLSFRHPLEMLQGSTSMVEIVVGEEASVWYLHEKILTAGSAFFKAAINSRFREGIERKITLAEDENQVFRLFVQYLYSKAFQASPMRLLLRAYVLGDKLGASDFQAHAFDQIFSHNFSQCQFTAEQVLWVFDNTLPGCALRRLTADTIAYATLRQNLDYGKEEWGTLAPVMPELMEGVISFAGVQDAKDKWTRKSRLAYQDRHCWSLGYNPKHSTFEDELPKNGILFVK